VFASHLPRPTNTPGTIGTFANAGYNGVTLHFVLSGFVLTYTYAGWLADPDRREVGNSAVASSLGSRLSPRLRDGGGVSHEQAPVLNRRDGDERVETAGETRQSDEARSWRCTAVVRRPLRLQVGHGLAPADAALVTAKPLISITVPVLVEWGTTLTLGAPPEEGDCIR
jgi:hypothetical protein